MSRSPRPIGQCDDNASLGRAQFGRDSLDLAPDGDGELRDVAVAITLRNCRLSPPVLDRVRPAAEAASLEDGFGQSARVPWGSRYGMGREGAVQGRAIRAPAALSSRSGTPGAWFPFVPGDHMRVVAATLCGGRRSVTASLGVGCGPFVVPCLRVTCKATPGVLVHQLSFDYRSQTW